MCLIGVLVGNSLADRAGVDINSPAHIIAATVPASVNPSGINVFMIGLLSISHRKGMLPENALSTLSG
ncbi:protein of unknown function [Burkholderia multivorans]